MGGRPAQPELSGARRVVTSLLDSASGHIVSMQMPDG